jgi:anti-sigma factor RsiW
VRMCLERYPEARYASALELGQALEAGLHGELTDATRALAAEEAALPDDTEATRALSEITEATEQLRTRRTGSRPAVAAEPAAAEVPARRRRPDRAERQARRRRRLGGLFALLAVLLAGAAVAIALLAAGNGSGVDPVTRDDVQQQIDDLKGFLRDHSR